MAETRRTKVLIVGSGPAGYTAGVYAARAMLEPILVQGMEPGGQLTTTTEVENWPGHTEIQGPELMVNMEAHAKAMGCEVITDIITAIDFEKRPFTARSDSGTVYVADQIIHATVARRRNGWACRSEEKFKGFGVSACATCDGFSIASQEIERAATARSKRPLFLTNFTSKVTLVHRRTLWLPEKILQDSVCSRERRVENPVGSPAETRSMATDNPHGRRRGQGSSM